MAATHCVFLRLDVLDDIGVALEELDERAVVFDGLVDAAPVAE